MAKSSITLHKNDLPAGLSFGPSVAVDTETLGLNVNRDRLCLVQLSSGDGTAHLVQFDGSDYAAPNLKALLTDPAVLKIFHYARFDIAVHREEPRRRARRRSTAPRSPPSWCAPTPTATDSRISSASLSASSCQSSSRAPTGPPSELSQQQLAYAASDVLHLHALKAKLDAMLAREGPRSVRARRHSASSARAPSSISPASARTIFSRIEVSGGEFRSRDAIRPPAPLEAPACRPRSPNITPIDGDISRYRPLSSHQPAVTINDMATTTNFGAEQEWTGSDPFGGTTAADRARNFARARRHTRVVRTLRFSLPSAGGRHRGALLRDDPRHHRVGRRLSPSSSCRASFPTT